MQIAALAFVVSFTVACSAPTASDDGSHPVSEPTVGRVLDRLPDPIDPRGRYLVYLHNRFAESADPGAVHPTYGPYDLEGILAAFAERRFTVIAPRRGPDADPKMWADRVAATVDQLLAAAVPPQKITVVGFSKGGAIAILTSSQLANNQVNFVFLASCGPWIRSVDGLEPRGRMLSIFESSDELAGSCSELFSMTPDGTIHIEREIHMGGGHGAFFRPNDAWIRPTVDWARGIDASDRRVVDGPG